MLIQYNIYCVCIRRDGQSNEKKTEKSANATAHVFTSSGLMNGQRGEKKTRRATEKRRTIIWISLFILTIIDSSRCLFRPPRCLCACVRLFFFFLLTNCLISIQKCPMRTQRFLLCLNYRRGDDNSNKRMYRIRKTLICCTYQLRRKVLERTLAVLARESLGEFETILVRWKASDKLSCERYEALNSTESSWPCSLVMHE